MKKIIFLSILCSSLAYSEEIPIWDLPDTDYNLIASVHFVTNLLNGVESNLNQRVDIVTNDLNIASNYLDRTIYDVNTNLYCNITNNYNTLTNLIDNSIWDANTNLIYYVQDVSNRLDNSIINVSNDVVRVENRFNDYALNTNVVHASHIDNIYEIQTNALKIIDNNNNYVTISYDPMIYVHSSDGDTVTINSNDILTENPVFIINDTYNYFAPTNSGYIALTQNPDGSPDIDLSDYATVNYVNSLSNNFNNIIFTNTLVGSYENELLPYSTDFITPHTITVTNYFYHQESPFLTIIGPGSIILDGYADKGHIDRRSVVSIYPWGVNTVSGSIYFPQDVSGTLITVEEANSWYDPIDTANNLITDLKDNYKWDYETQITNKLIAGSGINITTNVISIIDSYVRDLVKDEIRKAINEGIEVDGTNYVLVIQPVN